MPPALPAPFPAAGENPQLVASVLRRIRRLVENGPWGRYRGREREREGRLLTDDGSREGDCKLHLMAQYSCCLGVATEVEHDGTGFDAVVITATRAVMTNFGSISLTEQQFTQAGEMVFGELGLFGRLMP